MQNRCLQMPHYYFLFSIHFRMRYRALQAEEVIIFLFRRILLLVGQTPCLISSENLKLQLTWAIMKSLGEPIKLTLGKTLCLFTGKKLLKIT